MALEKMSILIDSNLKKEFLKCVLRHYDNAEEGILDLMKIYIEKVNGAPAQSEIKAKVRETVFEGDKGSGLKSREIEKIMLNKTDEEIESNRLA